MFQEQGHDTVEANKLLGLPEDCREYFSVKNILEELEVKSIQLMVSLLQRKLINFLYLFKQNKLELLIQPGIEIYISNELFIVLTQFCYDALLIKIYSRLRHVQLQFYYDFYILKGHFISMQFYNINCQISSIIPVIVLVYYFIQCTKDNFLQNIISMKYESLDITL